MARKKVGNGPPVGAYEDFSDDLGWVDPKFLFEAIKHVGIYVYDIETIGNGKDALNPRKGRLDGLAFYVPAGAPKDFGPLGYYDGKPIRAWFPFNDFSFMCHIRVKDIPSLEPKLVSIGVDMMEIYETAKTPEGKPRKPEALILVSLRPPMDQERTMEALRPIWQDLPDVIGVTHHGKFDNGFMWVASGCAHPIRVRNIWGDSMLADFASDERRKRYGLKIRVKQEFNHQMTEYKDAVRGQSMLAFVNARPLGLYAMDDCYWEYRLHERSIKNLREQEPTPLKRTEPKWTPEKRHGRVMGRLERVYWGIDTRISEIIMEMQNAGVLIDWQWLRQVDKTMTEQKDEIKIRIEEFLGWPLNPNATKQVADALFSPAPDGLGLPQKGIPIGKTGDPSTSDKVIKHFARFHPLVADILKWRSLDTIQGGFVQKLIKLALESPDGRVYAHFNQTRTVIARLSCVSAETILDTSHGSVRIADLDLSDGRNYTIETHRGRQRRILRRFYKGREEMFDVETEDGRKITCTAKHRFLTPQGWKTLGDVNVGDRFIVRANVGVAGASEALERRQKGVERGELRSDLHRGAEDTDRADETLRRLLPGAHTLPEALRTALLIAVEGAPCAKPLASDERQRPWQARQRRQATSQHQETPATGSSGGYGSSRLEGREDRPRTEDDRAPRSSEHQALRDPARLPTPATTPAHRASGVGALGEIGSGVYRGGSEVLRRATRVLRDDLPGDGEAQPIGGRPEIVCVQPSILHSTRVDTSGPHRVVAKSQRGSTLARLADGGDPPPSGVLLLQELESRLLLPGSQAAGRGGRRVSHQGRTNQGSRQAQAEEGQGTWLHSPAVLDQASREGTGVSSHEDSGFAEATITSITSVGVEDVWDIEVEEDHSYLDAHGFVNHNSSDPINFQNQPRDKNLVRKAYVSHRVGIKTDNEDLLLLGGDYCVVEGTLVATERGWIPIEEIQEGVDRAFLEDGSSAQIAKLIDRGALPVVEVETKLGFKLRATALHRIRVIDQNGNYVWRRIGELAVTDHVALQPGRATRSQRLQELPPLVFDHPRNRRNVSVPTHLTEEVSELLGYIVGDGCIEYKQVGIVVAQKDPDVWEWSKTAIAKTFAPHIRERTYRGVYEARFSSRPIVRWLNELGVSKEGIMPLLWTAPFRSVCGFLRGLFEADGSISKRSNGNRISWSSSRESLARNIQLLLLGVGIPTKFIEEHHKLGVGYKLTIPSGYAHQFASSIGFIGKRKRAKLTDYLKSAGKSPSVGGYPHLQSKVKNLELSGELRRLLNNTSSLARPISKAVASHIKQVEGGQAAWYQLELYRITDYGTVFDAVKRITPIGKEPVYDLSVPGPTTYISDGFVSHNSQIELRVAAHLSGEANMIEVYQMGGICKAEASGDACERYKVWVCDGCDHKWTPELWSAPKNSQICPACKSKERTEHQGRCRHVDLHQRTADDAQVKRNPLAKNCVTGDSMILTEHGLLRMDEVVTEEGRVKKAIGIMSDDGKIRQTESTWGGGIQSVADIHMEYGLKVTATYDHKFFVMREGKVEQIPVEDLKPGDPVLIMVGRDVHGKDIALPQVEVEAHSSYKDVDLPRFLTSEVARFLGYFVSEGRQESDPDRGYYQVQFGFSETESVGMIKDFVPCMRALVNDRYNEWSKDSSIYYTITSKKVNAWFDRLGMGYTSGEKVIPACVRRAPWSLKREFFRALFEGDGNSKSSGEDDKCRVISYTSKSEELIRQIQAEMMNVNILGYVSSETRPTQKGRQRYWVWTVRRQSDLVRFAEMVGFVSARKQARMEKLLIEGVTDYSNRFLDGVEPLLETIYNKVKRKQKDKLREVIQREEKSVRFGDTRVSLLANVLPDEINAFIDAGIWTAKVRSVECAGEAEVFDVYEPERTAMVVNSCVIFDCNFGLLYRMGAPKFCVYADLFDSDGLPMVRYAKNIIERWHKAYPAIAVFHEVTEFNLEREGWIAKTLFGRRRRLDQEARINRFRAVTQGVQFKVSGTAQDIMKTGMIRLWDAREEKIANARPAERKLWQKFKFLMQIHDEVIMEVPRQIKNEAAVIVKREMESVGAGSLRIPLIFDVKTGTNWDHIH